jgi:hypothetical protein
MTSAQIASAALDYRHTGSRISGPGYVTNIYQNRATGEYAVLTIEAGQPMTFEHFATFNAADSHARDFCAKTRRTHATNSQRH